MMVVRWYTDGGGDDDNGSGDSGDDEEDDDDIKHNAHLRVFSFMFPLPEMIIL